MPRGRHACNFDAHRFLTVFLSRFPCEPNFGRMTAKPSTTTEPTGTLISRPAVRRRLAYEEKTIKSCKKETSTKNQARTSGSRSSQGGRAEQPAFVRVPARISTFHQ